MLPRVDFEVFERRESLAKELNWNTFMFGLRKRKDSSDATAIVDDHVPSPADVVVDTVPSPIESVAAGARVPWAAIVDPAGEREFQHAKCSCMNLL